MKLISIVIPCYNSEATIRKVVEMVMEEFKKMDGYDCEFVLVNDGSPKDNTYGEIKKLGEQYQNVKGINLLRNFGQHNALMAALTTPKETLFSAWTMTCRHIRPRSAN